MSYISGSLVDLAVRLNQLPTGVADVSSFVSEAQNQIALGLVSSGLMVELDYICRLKKFQFNLDPTGLAIPLLY